MTASASFIISARAEASFRRAGSIEASAMSLRRSSRWRICRPVVPASPSMKTEATPVHLRAGNPAGARKDGARHTAYTRETAESNAN
jgi:hypothetical protein